MTKSLMDIPRSDELPPLPEPQGSLEDESLESKTWKVMRTEVEELGCLSYLCIIKKQW